MRPKPLFLGSLLLLAISCSKDPGEINVTVNIPTGIDKTQIQSFIFVTYDPTPRPTPRPKILYPAACVDVSGCLVRDPSCGFTSAKGDFWRPSLKFSDYPEGPDSYVTLVACAMGADQTTIATGAGGPFPNVSTTSVQIDMTAATKCGDAPEVCTPTP
jgi:hypothetical protein